MAATATEGATSGPRTQPFPRRNPVMPRSAFSMTRDWPARGVGERSEDLIEVDLPDDTDLIGGDPALEEVG